jgi:hypothetical protein
VPEPRTGRGGRVVAVLGYSSRRGRDLHPICAGRLSHSQELAEGARAVIFSGWARRSHSRPEAELMRAAWSGPAVPIVCDADARTTAENAANVATLARGLGVNELVVITSWWHRPRAWLLLKVALRGCGMRLTVAAPRGRLPLLLLGRELACFALLPLHVGRARRRRADVAASLTVA